MRVNLSCSPSYTIAYCYLSSGEELLAEAGAMAAMSAGVRVAGSVGPGGVGKAVMRRALGGEGFFMGRYRAEVEGAWVALAPRYPGDIAVESVHPESGFVVEQGALLGLSSGVAADVKWAGMRNIALREGATLLHIAGEGDMLIASYGGLQRFDLGPGEQLVVDTGHLVGFSDTMKVRVGLVGGAVGSVTSGEGLVGSLTGPGVVFIQTRAEQALLGWLMPARGQNSGNR
jgi:uncharacterized protein (TIGR00266 family)